MAKSQSPDPTTVLERVMREPLEQPSRRSGRVGTIILVGIVGFLAGVAGGLVAMSLVLPVPFVFENVVLRRSRAAARTTSALPAIAPIATSVVDLFAVDGKSDLPALIPLERRTGRGVALTSDGWVVTVRAALPKQTGARPFVVTAARTIHAVDRIALDPISDLAFVHVPNLEASVLPLRPRDGLPIGTALFTPTTDGGLAVLTLQALTARLSVGDARSSEQWTSVLAVAPDADAPIGTPVVDGDGAMVGMIVGPGHAIAVDAITSALPSLFADGAVKRNALGVTYRDAADFAFGSTALTEGVTLARAGRTPALGPASPLKGKLVEGDVILAVGDDRLTGRRPLAELIQEYPLGATIEIRARHGERELVVPVTLATIAGEALLVAAPATRSP
ncbi:MAG: S1C family serine protease [bacterium]|nr:S1C family serine protease [bacterium]